MHRTWVLPVVEEDPVVVLGVGRNAQELPTAAAVGSVSSCNLFSGS
jgi:hypothetical protein